MDNIKSFAIRMKEDIWRDLKKIAFHKEKSLNALIVEQVEKFIKKEQKIVDKY